MANVLSVVFFVLGMVVTHAAIIVWVAVMLPDVVSRAQRRIEAGPRTCLLLGWLFCLAGGVVLLGLLPLRSAGFNFAAEAFEYLAHTVSLPRSSNDHMIATHSIAWLLVSPIMAGWIVGGSALSRIFAARAEFVLGMRSQSGSMAMGSLCLGLSYFLPFVGWFVFLPIVAPLSVGAGIVAILVRRERPASGVTPQNMAAHSEELTAS